MIYNQCPDDSYLYMKSTNTNQIQIQCKGANTIVELFIYANDFMLKTISPNSIPHNFNK